MANVGKQIADMDDMQDAKMPASHHKKSDYSDVSDHEIKVWTSIILPETNMAPENTPLEKEIPIGNHHFWVLC